jgi:hypothetical protein
MSIDGEKFTKDQMFDPIGKTAEMIYIQGSIA